MRSARTILDGNMFPQDRQFRSLNQERRYEKVALCEEQSVSLRSTKPTAEAQDGGKNSPETRESLIPPVTSVSIERRGWKTGNFRDRRHVRGPMAAKPLRRYADEDLLPRHASVTLYPST